MFTEEQIREVIKQKIETDEKLGEQSGGSGHLGYSSYSLDKVKSNQLPGGLVKIQYSYTFYVETEFTIYPDNPPMEYSKSKVIVIDKNKNIISEV